MGASPNAAHLAIADMVRRVDLLTVITQNVDDLHERAGSRTPIHMHGSLFAPRCAGCASPARFPAGVQAESAGGGWLSPPQCARCGDVIRPGVVWFGEELPAGAMAQAFDAARSCDVLLSIGTSGAVYPAAEIPLKAVEAGATVVVVNPVATPSVRQRTACRHYSAYHHFIGRNCGPPPREAF